MVVQHNLTAMNANRYLGINNSKLSKSLEKLSSGYAINRAGDNAAGLAVSEKMRSQIAGMTQGVKNAQDGISMVQTFEGALTETDSILQRMKTLADQMANGSYDDPVDRTAAQQEFLQLSDELDQIADTDFNGVIVLNGGKMADGLEQVDGLFDYANKADQVAAANSEALMKLQAEAQSKIDAATKNVAAAQKALNNTPVDMSNMGGAKEWNTVDNNSYGKTEAEAIFGTETAAGGTGDVVLTKDGETLADKGATSVDITFEYDGSAWVAKKASALDGNGDAIEFDNDKLSAAIKTTLANVNANTGLGGFTVDGTTANAIFDSTAVKEGDTVTLTFTNEAATTYAPNNIGMDADSLDMEGAKGVSGKPTIEMDAGITDAAMTADISDGLKLLDKANVSIEYNGDQVTVSLLDENDVAIVGLKTGTATDNGDGTSTVDVTYDGADGTVTLAQVTYANGSAASTGTVAAGAPATVAGAAGQTSGATSGSATLVYDAANNAWYAEGDAAKTAVTTVNVGQVANNMGVGVDNAVTVANVVDDNGGAFADGDKITITATANGGGVDMTYSFAAMPASSGTVTFGAAVDAFNYSKDGGYTVKAGKDTAINSEVVVAKQNALEKAKAELQAAKDAYPTELPAGVSKADAFDKSEAKMTYKDSITLQTGARTKDAVNFTFKYNSDSIGDLKADLNCTAAGLGIDKLSLSTQEDANFAIDKIDQAINKVSLVRGTFGAIQNRLEHKIDNMNVSIENLTSAESQIRDTDMPTEMMNFTKQQILAQASQSMLAQANQLPQSVLSLLQ